MTPLAVFVRTLLKTSALFIGVTVVMLHPSLEWSRASGLSSSRVTARQSPTEAAVDVTAWMCDRDSELPFVPIGKPVANTQIHILDDEMRPVPVGTAGELHIGGVQVGRGYLRRPELTAERFVPDPFSPEAGATLYKTGDLVQAREIFRKALALQPKNISIALNLAQALLHGTDTTAPSAEMVECRACLKMVGLMPDTDARFARYKKLKNKAFGE